jgi:hypothetical protein
LDEAARVRLAASRGAVAGKLFMAMGKAGGGRCEVWRELTDDAASAVLPTDAIVPPGRRIFVRSDSPAVKAHVFDVGVEQPMAGGAAALVREVNELCQAGQRLFIFEPYGQIPMDRLDWLRQAIRFARREAGTH